MSHYRRREPSPLDRLLLSRRNVFLKLPTGGHVLIGATRIHAAVHVFSDGLRADPLTTLHLPMTPELFDGTGWGADELAALIEELRTIDQKR